VIFRSAHSDASKNISCSRCPGFQRAICGVLACEWHVGVEISRCSILILHVRLEVQAISQKIALLLQWPPLKNGAEVDAACHLAQAAASLITHLPVQQMSLLGAQLIEPMASGLSPEAIQHSAPEQVALKLQLLAIIFSVLDLAAFSAPDGSAAMVQLTERCWQPLCTLAAMPALTSPVVASAFCKLLKTLVTSCVMEHCLQLLPLATPLLTAAFQAHPSAACLQAAAAVADFLETCKSDTSSQLQPFYKAADGMLQSVLATASNADQGVDTDVIPDALSLVSRLVCFHPYQALQQHSLSTKVQLCMVALRSSDSVAVGVAASALKDMVAAHPAQEEGVLEQGASLNALQLVLHHAQRIVQDVLICLCHTAPQLIWMSLARVLFAFMCAHGTAAAHVLHDTLMDASFESILDTPLTREDCERVAHLVERGSFAERRFCALIMDFASIAQGMDSSDVLLAYEVPERRAIIALD
jgi:hypothetical protein